MNPHAAAPDDAPPASCVIVHAPTANDARLTAEFLQGAGFLARICEDFAELENGADEQWGCFIVAEEALLGDSSRLLVSALERQPSWSDIPVIIITSGGKASIERLQRLALLGPGGNVSLLERPFRPDTLVSATAVALKARSRQYEVRDLLQALGTARDEAERANRAKDDFLAALSHELRTPLNPVLLLASAGAANPSLPESVRAAFSVIRKNVNLEARLIDDLLDLTRIVRGKLQLEKIRCSIHVILRDAASNVQGEADEKTVRVELALNATADTVRGDPVRLQQVFWNVIKNAVKFTPEESTVFVESANTPDGGISVRITDSGIGLDHSELEHIFDAFSQGEHALGAENIRHGGLGLGLYISRMLVELHEGRITAASDGPGRGSTFTIALPAAAPERREQGPSARSEAGGPSDDSTPSARPRVLLIEDHADTLAALMLLLRRNYEVVTAASGKEARARASEGGFDIVISDIGLPDERGNDLMEYLMTTYGLKGIALTGYGMDEDVKRSRAAGFVAHLTKPVEFSTLEKTLSEALS